ncbi:cupin domain-containing protein [Pseudomonas piscis]|uniref:Cupin domain-containing protein n=1 Tax=Pseudomonas piscis TaxID=2614538 RepID=A0ABY9NLK5_9PSED|nr:cupin domain-containing protein [Pseudomonas piscis]WMN18768.1 cupin domain-containing protein [Pseudomonas piscis]
MTSYIIQNLPDEFSAIIADREVYKGDGGENFEPALNWETLNRLLASDILEYPRIRLVKEGEPFSRAFCGFINYRQANNGGNIKTLNMIILSRLLSEGCTLVIDRCQSFFPGIQEHTEALSKFFRCPVSASIYVSWTSHSGFGLHNDNHDVIALQIHGKKRWDIYLDAPRSVVTKSFSKVPPVGESSSQHELSPGQFLYIPRGVWHNVYSEQTPSLHISFTIFRPRYSDLARTILNALAHGQFMEEPIPLNNERLRLDVFEKIMKSALSEESIKYWENYLRNNVTSSTCMTVDTSLKHEIN